MKDIRYNSDLQFNIKEIGLVSVVRDNNFYFEYKSGKIYNSFIFIENGELEYYFLTLHKRIKVESKVLLYIPKNIPYKVKYLADNTKITIITFLLSSENKDLFANIFSRKDKSIVAVFNSIIEENATSNYFLTSKFYEIIYHLMKEPVNIEKKYKKIMVAINDIKNNYFENKEIKEYADICNMSESNFRLLFKEYTGKSPIEYRNYIRIIEAEKLIATGEFTMIEIAYMVGFNNMSFFYNVFNRYKT